MIFQEFHKQGGNFSRQVDGSAELPAKVQSSSQWPQRKAFREVYILAAKFNSVLFQFNFVPFQLRHGRGRSTTMSKTCFLLEVASIGDCFNPSESRSPPVSNSVVRFPAPLVSWGT